jgi:hypothetical protein
MIIDTNSLDSIIAAIVAIIMAIVAWYQTRKKNVALEQVTAITQSYNSALTAAVVQENEATVNNDFALPRDGRILYRGMGGWYARINPSPQAATIPDDKAYQAVSPNGKFYSGNKETIYYLLTSAEADGWRERNK